MTPKLLLTRRAERGMTLLEVLAVLAIGMLLAVGLNAMIDDSLEEAKSQQAAQQQALLADAARRYLAAKYGDLLLETASATKTVTVAALRSEGFLAPGFSDTNGYGQSACVIIKQPAAEKLEALAVTYGGQPIPDRHLIYASMNAGSGAGYISSANSDEARGTSWLISLPAYGAVTCGGVTALTAGHLVSNIYYGGPDSNTDNFVYRDNVGKPELNQMNTPLRMAHDALATTGAACGTQPALAIDPATGSALVCFNNRWISSASSWKEPVDNYAALAAIGGNVGDVRLDKETKRAFAYDGSQWVALAVDQDGNLAVPGNLHTQTIRSDGDVLSVNGDIHGKTFFATGDMRVAGDVLVQRNIIADRGAMADWSSSGRYHIKETITAGARCNYPGTDPDGITSIWWPTGSFAMDANGLILSCYADNTFRYTNGTYTP